MTSCAVGRTMVLVCLIKGRLKNGKDSANFGSFSAGGFSAEFIQSFCMSISVN